ncbi:MAG: hypothetical protein LC803_09685 [Acidobacteria bacterium]|nr:hypothetical protein [Acidobacteriota bacterium]
MPPTITWDDVEVDFAALEADGVYAPLDGAIEPIQRLIGSRQYSPEMVKHFIKKLREMNAAFGKMIRQTKDEANNKQSLRKVVQQAEADFVQSNWTVDSVTNAQNIFNFVFEPVKKEVAEPDPSIRIPVVLPVMTHKEAKELDSGKITVAMPANYVNDFNAFKALLKPDWLKNYGTTPEQWKPFDSASHNIEDLMTEMLGKVRDNKGYQKPLVPYFIRVHDLNKNRTILNYLRLNGCYVVNDVISMWHPNIQRSYRASLLDAFPSTIVFRIAPLNQNKQPLNSAQPLISFLEQFHDLEFFKRMDADSDLKCKDMWMSTEFKQFVMNFTPELIPPYDKINSPLAGRIIGESTR